MIVEVCGDSNQIGLINSSGWSIVCKKMPHIALSAICSKIEVNFLVEMLLLRRGFEIGI